MEPSRVYCRECICWCRDVKVDVGVCKRHSPQTQPMIGAMWPQTKDTDFCYDGIKSSKDLLNE